MSKFVEPLAKIFIILLFIFIITAFAYSLFLTPSYRQLFGTQCHAKSGLVVWRYRNWECYSADGRFIPVEVHYGS